jgi:catechol 2,3-dioxygenase-like lactoylglutathione lyase family enzyme
MQPHGILETALYVADLDVAERFYIEVLGLTVFARQPDRHVFFRAGSGMLLLFDADATSTQPTHADGHLVPAHGTRGSGHMAFSIHAAEIDAWREHLMRVGVTIESEFDWPAGGHSIYFRDPSGNSLELATPAVWRIPEREGAS